MTSSSPQGTPALLSKFPKRLREISDPPKKLYIKGVLPAESHKWLCVVGARKYTPYGKSACEYLIHGLAGLPVVIVSGLALGIDSIAHESALAAGLKTVGVPGSGLDPEVLYPSTSRSLADKILSNGGALLSEFEPDFKATQWSFPQRNRIMAGLSDAILVVEAELKSGTLITARLAADYNRDVLAVAGPMFSSTSQGPNMLIQKGAALIDSPESLKSTLGFEESGKPIERDYSKCGEKELLVLQMLDRPLSKQDLIETLDLPASDIYSVLTTLEIKGLIKEELGEIRRT